MAEVFEFPSEDVRLDVQIWRQLEDAWRAQLRKIGTPADCEAHVIRVLREMYEDQAVGRDFPPEGLAFFYHQLCAKLMQQIVRLEVELWNAGLRDGGQPNNTNRT